MPASNVIASDKPVSALQNSKSQKKGSSDKPASVGFVSLGCPKALVDSERILTRLKLDGYAVTPDYADADVVVVNTCGFIDSAKQESLDTIGEALRENGRVIVTGCMGKDAASIVHEHPEVLSVSGPAAYDAVVSAVHQHAPASAQVHDPRIDLVPPQGIKLTPKHYAYLKISEGCNHSCSFCIIPSLRGDLVSRPIDEVLAEAEQLADAGVQELLIISQDTSAYGVDSKYREAQWQGRAVKTNLQTLCEELGNLGIWVRLHYVYPYPHVDRIIPLMAEGKILPYLDIPFQHASPRLLKSMRRPAHQAKTLQRIQRWREICPEIAIRSTFIVGFPGETEEDFELLLEFLQQAQLDHVGCFQYSAVDGATANALPDHVPEALKQERWDRFMALQQQISAAKLQAKIDWEMPVIIDQVGPEGAIGRSYADAPQIDGQVHLPGVADVAPGDVVMARIVAADEYDLEAELATS